jgi:hypothetical protein
MPTLLAVFAGFGDVAAFGGGGAANVVVATKTNAQMMTQRAEANMERLLTTLIAGHHDSRVMPAFKLSGAIGSSDEQSS